jgi:hypothetical protein
MSVAETLIEKINALPPERAQEALRCIESLDTATGEPGCALRSVIELNLDGPPDISEGFHQAVYGAHARDDK